MKIDPRRCNMLPAPLPFEACSIKMTGNLVAKLSDGRVVLESDGIDSASPAPAATSDNIAASRPFQMKNLRLTKSRISKLQEAAIKVSGFIDTLNLTSDARTDLYAALLYAHVKNAQHDFGELPGLECVLERFSLMVSKLLTNTKVIIKNSYEKKSAMI